MDWNVPTAVQRLSIPAVLEMEHGNSASSLWCEGPTGSGKVSDGNEKRYHRLAPTHHRSARRLAALRFRYCKYLSMEGNGITAVTVRDKRGSKAQLMADTIYGGKERVEEQVARLARRRREGVDLDVLVATPGRLRDVLRYGEQAADGNDVNLSALERRIMEAFDSKTDTKREERQNRKKRKGRGNYRGSPEASSLSLKDIEDMDLDRVDDDGRGAIVEMLENLNYLVLDEADRLLAGSFKEEIDDILNLLPKPEDSRMKTLLFSATYPQQIEERVDQVLSQISSGQPLRVSTTSSMRQRLQYDENEAFDAALSNRQRKHIERTTQITSVLPDSSPDIDHRAIRLEDKDRTQALRYLLDQHSVDEWDRVMVFVSTRYLTEHISRKLRRYDVPASELHGRLDQDARERRLKAFRSGRTRVLVCTDLAARGVDIEGLPVVVNYDLPRASADYTHRTGRTGRAGRHGTAVTFVTSKSAAHFDLIERNELGAAGGVAQEVLENFPVDESRWNVEVEATQTSVPGAVHSPRGLEHDKMFGGVKGRRKSKKDRLREKAAAAASREGAL
ncbi:hypothetical protein THAOC_19966 [Thalassiosira oceanica]|uniref:RNA helicase n=1 Tax=Thalassiosira oceanica TaxID=159749 RepID=K0S3I4_THAOC|nr:hypothetical protein THAOC_19966 [Thalassiosira oceanica]|eukprot:EJK59770.1 hypothetical protein THAOC_19966 [Thalassiosira oceanica]